MTLKIYTNINKTKLKKKLELNNYYHDNRRNINKHINEENIKITIEKNTLITPNSRTKDYYGNSKIIIQI